MCNNLIDGRAAFQGVPLFPLKRIGTLPCVRHFVCARRIRFHSLIQNGYVSTVRGTTSGHGI